MSDRHREVLVTHGKHATRGEYRYARKIEVVQEHRMSYVAERLALTEARRVRVEREIKTLHVTR